MTSERTLQLAPRGVAENRKALLEEISNALRSGECQWLFAGNRVTVYEQGEYRGKADTRPWDGGEFKGDRAAWEKALKERARGQNEYNRVQ